MSLVVIGTSLCDDMFTGREAIHPFMTEVGPWQIVFPARDLTRTHKAITIMSRTNKSAGKVCMATKFQGPPKDSSRGDQDLASSGVSLCACSMEPTEVTWRQ